MSSVCDDLSEFLDTLKKMRVVDDKIVHELNTSIPTESFSTKIDAHETCKKLFLQLVESHAVREQGIRQCFAISSEKLQKLREQKTASPNDLQVLKQLHTEQTQFRELQTQMNVEEIIRGRSLTIFNERCRLFYKPTVDNK